jgi:hypothetical protein
LWVREFFTLAVSRDVYAGVPAIYVNYLDYDVAAHAFGPASRHALRSLRRVDRSIHKLWRVIRRVPEHRYDLYVLSDHGQAHCRPFPKLTGGKRLERYLFDEFLGPKHAGELGATNGRRPGFASEVRAYRRSEKGLLQRFVNYLENDFLLTLDEHEAHEQGGIRVVAAGPNAFVYVVDTAEPVPIEILDKRFPGLAEDISRSVGVGFVLARSEGGPVCFWRGQRYQLHEEPGPFAAREDVALVLRGITDLMAMPSAGDLVIYGIGAPEGNVSFIPEIGAHAGPSREELHTFIVHPAGVDLPALIDHPVQLYDHFIRYQEPP